MTVFVGVAAHGGIVGGGIPCDSISRFRPMRVAGLLRSGPQAGFQRPAEGMRRAAPPAAERVATPSITTITNRENPIFWKMGFRKTTSAWSASVTGDENTNAVRRAELPLRRIASPVGEPPDGSSVDTRPNHRPNASRQKEKRASSAMPFRTTAADPDSPDQR